MHLAHGIYEALLDEVLQDALSKRPELRRIFGKIDAEEQPALYASFVAKVLEQALREETDPEKRLGLCNRVLGTVAAEPGRGHLEKHRLVPTAKPLLLEITPPNYNQTGIPRPHTSLAESSLFTGSPQEPQLAHELLEEMRSADGVDILVSFIKWSGLRLLMPAFEDLRDRQVPVRLITTSYMGASDAPAVEWLAKLPNVQVRVSYDTERTRLHAKAYHFRRQSGFSTAYIGSANMSHAAITSGLEWNLKVTAQDMGHILEKFSVEFETYWNSREFIPFDAENPTLFRTAIDRARNPRSNARQSSLICALTRFRSVSGRHLIGSVLPMIVGATWSSPPPAPARPWSPPSTSNASSSRNRSRPSFFSWPIARRFSSKPKPPLPMSSATRISENCWSASFRPIEWNTSSVPSACSPTAACGSRWGAACFYDYIVVDEAHHGTASSYRSLFDHFTPQILLGLTATPERMDGDNVAADFGNRFAAEIRLPEALEEKLLCPFHYFGVADPIAINGEQFWRNGKYDASALENVYVLDNVRAKQRVDAIVTALHRYEPDFTAIKGIGFCVSIKHAEFMADTFADIGIPAAAFVSGVDGERCQELLADLKNGQITFLFTVDKLSEGVDVPEINTVLFLRPTESLTVFLQQLGRGLRHAPGKDCLTVLDFVGQTHRRYRVDTKLKALLPRHRFSIDKEVEQDFPHLPAGCSIQLDRLSRQYVLENIRENLGRLAVQVPDRLQTFTSESGLELTFGNFISYHDYEPEVLLAKESWSEWKAKAQMVPIPMDPDLVRLKKTLLRATFINGPQEVALLRQVLAKVAQGNVDEALALAGDSVMSAYYRLWGDKGSNLGITSLDDAFRRLARNPSVLADLDEVLAWSQDTTEVSGLIPQLPFACPLELHARYGGNEIQVVFGRANLETAGQRGVGVFHFPEFKAYVLLVTFQKTEKEFSPSTMYADYPISRELMHWESQANTAQHHTDGQNLIHHHERGYTILVFARDQKKRNNVTVPFTYLGPVDMVSYESERPIKVVWRLRHPMPVEMFEDNRRGG